MKVVLSVAVVTALLLSGCSQDKKEEVIVEEVVVSQTPAPTIVQEVSVAVVEDESDNAVEVVEESVTAVADEAGNVAVVDEVVAVVTDAASDVVEVATAKVAEVVAVKDESALDGAALYKSCSGCHGASGEKPALGKSKVITAWSVDQTTTALNGYKDGSYGGSMKGIMKGQSSKLSDAEIKAIAEYISTL